MGGYWVIDFRGTADGQTDRIRFGLDLQRLKKLTVAGPAAELSRNISVVLYPLTGSA
jgi:hypothetical protein